MPGVRKSSHTVVEAFLSLRRYVKSSNKCSNHTAPNALAQMKKGFKGLFSRKQKKKDAKGDTAQTAPAVTGSTTEAKNDGNAPMMSTGMYEALPRGLATIMSKSNVRLNQSLTLDCLAIPIEPTSSTTPQIAEPGNVSSSQAIDLNPAVPAPGKEEGRLDSKVAADGMSATSGPVSTDLYGDEGTSAAAKAASKENVKDDASEEAIEDMEEGHAHREGTTAVGSEPAGEATKMTMT